MFRIMMKSKLHRATITESRLDYVGSLTIDTNLMELADLRPNEQVHVLDIDNGARFETYVIPGVAGSGQICVNGAAARLVQVGDKAIILSYALLAENESQSAAARVVILNDENVPRTIQRELAGTAIHDYDEQRMSSDADFTLARA